MAKITSLKEAKNRQEEAMQMLAEVRDFVGEKMHEHVIDKTDPVSKLAAERYVSVAVWFFTLKDAMHMIDPGWDAKPAIKREISAEDEEIYAAIEKAKKP